VSGPLSSLTSPDHYFEDFVVGQRMRHARGATVEEVENNFISKQVMNTAQAHWNEDHLKGGPLGTGRVVFGLITCSIVFGLAGVDTTEQAVAELGCTQLRFLAPVHHGDTLYAFSEVLATEDGAHPDAGVVTFRHWGTNQDCLVVFRGDRTVLVKRRSHWGSR
jgi:itaconyl-CoA hydratase